MISFEDEFRRVETGAPVHFRNLTLLPLMRPDVDSEDPGYLVLDEAIAQGVASVRELGGAGSVPELEFDNRAERPVLLVDGQELIGAKQNRVLNLTILVPAKTKLTIPVSCVEAGRWAYRSPDFKPAGHMMYSAARASRVEQVTSSMRRTGSRRSDQMEVWEDIALKAARMGVSSPTQAMAEIFERHSISVEEYVRAFPWQDRQAGTVFAIGGHPVGFDLFDHPATLRKLLPSLVRSYALDALDFGGATCEAAAPQAMAELLAQAAAASSFSDTAVGLGKDVRLVGPTLRGAALWAEDRYVHVCAFVNGSDPSRASISSRVSRPAQRRLRR